MKRLLFGFLLFFSAKILAYSQEVVCVTGKEYKGYIFPKNFPIWGFPPKSNRYTLNADEIEQAEVLIQKNIKDVCLKILNKKHSKHYSKRFFRKYVRQYVGRISENGHIIIEIILYRLDNNELKYDIKSERFWQQFEEDIVLVQDGGYTYGSMFVDLTAKKILEINMNGEA